MKIIVNQPFGIGDCVFAQTLVNRIASGRPIIWPVMRHFLDGLSRAYPHIKWVDWDTFQIDYNNRTQYEFEHPIEGRCTVLPVRWTTENMRVPYTDCMKSKYQYWGMDYNDWREHAMWVRDENREKFLCDGTHIDFLVNKTFGSDCKMTVDIPLQRGNGAVMMQVPNCSLFDWALTMERAKTIHTVNTSIIYLLEMLDLTAKEIHLYQRSIPGQTFGTIDYILKRHKYIFHP